jgi:hypothetical protein
MKLAYHVYSFHWISCYNVVYVQVLIQDCLDGQLSALSSRGSSIVPVVNKNNIQEAHRIIYCNEMQKEKESSRDSHHSNLHSNHLNASDTWQSLTLLSD